MKQIFIAYLLFFIFISYFSTVQAQTEQSKKDASVVEITALRNRLTNAIERRDRKELENLYAQDFTHTHASGQVDDKTTRISTLVVGETTIESAKTEQIKIRFYGKNTAVAVGQSVIETTRYRWTIVYFKTGKNWRIVASQATRTTDK